MIFYIYWDEHMCFLLYCGELYCLSFEGKNQSCIPHIHINWWWCTIFLKYITEFNMPRVSKLFSVKNQMLNIFSFIGHMASVATMQLCLCSQRPYVIEWTWLCSDKTFIYKNRWQARFGLWAIVCQPLQYGNVLLMIFASIFMREIFLSWNVFEKFWNQHYAGLIKWVQQGFLLLYFSDRVCVSLILFLP